MPPLPPWLPSKPSNSASQASQSAPKSPVIKREPGIEESPPHHAQANPWRESATRRRSASPPRAYPAHPKQRKKMERERATGGEVWQYLVSLRSDLYMAKSVSKVKSMRDLLALPRKRDLPEIWKTRLALEGASPGNLRLLVAYLVGDEPQASSIMCNSKGSNCAKEWQTVGPAMAAFDEGENVIYKAAAFPRCILFPEHGTSSTASRERQCVNAHYRESKAESMPLIWSPPASTAAPALPPTLPPVSSPAPPPMLPSAFSPASPPVLPPAFSPPPAQSYFPAPAESYSPAYSPPPAESYFPAPASTPFNRIERAMPATLFPETPSRRSTHEEPAQQETGSLTSTWEQRHEPLYLYGPGNMSISYAHSAGWLQDRQGQVLPTGINGTSLQILDLENTYTTTLLPSNMQSLICIVHEGTLEVIMQGVPVFIIGRGSQWTVGVGQECRVRNLGAGTKAVLYIVGISA